jgi:short-subunit dehydrogenase
MFPAIMSRTVAVITGASSGIGATFAEKLAPWHDLVLVARRKAKLDEQAHQLHTRFGASVDVIEADLTKDTDLTAVADRIAGDDRLALLVNNAGFGTKKRFWEASLDSQEQMHRLHVMATVRLCHAALRKMVERDYGGIINVSSVAAYIRGQGSTSYCATKSWMSVFTEGLYVELRGIQSNVKVQSLCPGFTYSEFHDAMGLDRSRLAPAAFWLSADEVVEASLAGLEKGKLFVIPGWRYRLLTALVSKLPSGVRVLVESARRGRSRVSLPNAETNGPGKSIEQGTRSDHSALN